MTSRAETEGGGTAGQSGAGWGEGRGGRVGAATASRLGGKQQHGSGISGENTQVLCKHELPAAPNVNTEKHGALQEFGFSLMLNLSEPVSDQLSLPPSPPLSSKPSPQDQHRPRAHIHTQSFTLSLFPVDRQLISVLLARYFTAAAAVVSRKVNKGTPH